MSVTATSVSKSFAGSGTGPYTMSPEVVFTATTEIQGTLDGVALTNGVDFTVDVGTQAVTTVASYTAGQTLVFYRVTAQTQDTTLSATETPSGTTVEAALDKTVRQIQEAHGKGDRSLKVPIGSTGYDIDSAVASGDYLKLNGTTLEGKSVTEVASDIGASDDAAAAAASAAAAATSETNAATSETNAATSETNAATSETNAAASETAAETAETNAEAAETNVNAILTALELGVADPEGVITKTAPAIGVGTDGTYWVKVTGSGNTGWKQVPMLNVAGELAANVVLQDKVQVIPAAGALGLGPQGLVSVGDGTEYGGQVCGVQRKAWVAATSAWDDRVLEVAKFDVDEATVNGMTNPHLILEVMFSAQHNCQIHPGPGWIGTTTVSPDPTTDTGWGASLTTVQMNPSADNHAVMRIRYILEIAPETPPFSGVTLKGAGGKHAGSTLSAFGTTAGAGGFSILTSGSTNAIGGGEDFRFAFLLKLPTGQAPSAETVIMSEFAAQLIDASSIS